MKDPIVEEVRKHRLEHTRKFGANLAAICADLRRIQKESGHEVVRLPPVASGLSKTPGRRVAVRN